MTTTSAKLQRLIDKDEITELVHAYCNAADRQDHEKMRALYHEDATDDHGAFFKGLAIEFIDRLPEIQAPMQILHHNVTTLNIKFPNSAICEHAEGEVYILAFHQIATDDGPMDLLIGGRYFDRYQKRDGKWKFAHRSVVADWANLHPQSQVNLDNDIIRGSLIGQPGADDPSYAFYQLFQRGQR
ncbi:SnoaL-like protein [Sinobacterium caligoides]|uniref:SnoaL-like protein n=1 Tax=Sinobacterium caligoides TaxID=933926 RepID=A0A3N2DMV6_9GAMM|nr:nuclear transport factor 2 family protein [Sinobacterium caligoides]ROS01146.1 SnoaL-like protein [Sinobacterium caligoides]